MSLADLLVDQKQIISDKHHTSVEDGNPILTPSEMSEDSNRTFDVRLNSTHSDPDNTVATLHVEHFVDHTWQPFQPDIHTNGFLIFVYSRFICQHTYLRMNATEQKLCLAFISGTFQLIASNDWHVLAIHADFNAYLSTGHASHHQVDYLIDRMKGCPVSRNIGKDVDKNTSLTIHGVSNRSDIRSHACQKLGRTC